MRDVIAALARNAETRGDDIAFGDPNERVTWRGLARRVAGAAGSTTQMPETLGLLAANGIDWVVTDLASVAAGRTLVPLPTMFSDGQLRHIVEAAGIGVVLADTANLARARNLAPRAAAIVRAEGDALPAEAGLARRVIFTSGSTGAPKGVRLGNRQLNGMARGLAGATGAHSGDRYLSLLPLALLLEQLCAIHVPVLVGGGCDIERAAAGAMAGGAAVAIADAVERYRPSATVLVPELLRRWVAELRLSGRLAPDSLRYVAVGGAPVPASLADDGWALGIPVHEGYGLSECASVVALNRMGERAAGTVGRPIGGVDVCIEDGEIVVRGETVMDGYLGAPAANGTWRTGDLGHFDAAGRLVVDGRRDNLLVTALGRNVQAEWVESVLAADPWISEAIVIGHGAPHLTAIVVPRAGAEADFADAARARDIVRYACQELPDYAIPNAVIVTNPAALAAANLLTPTGRPDRAALAAHFMPSAGTTESRKDRVTL